MLRSVLYVLCTLASFVGVSTIVSSFVPWPEAHGLAPKIEAYLENGEEYDALFIGSSRTVRGLDNRIVDARLEAEGIPFRSFNLAIGGCRVFEQDHILHSVLADPPERLRYVFLEGGPVGIGVREDHVFRDPPNLWSTRGVYWHTFRATLLVLEAIARLPVPTGRKLVMASTHAHVFLWRLTSYGRGQSLIRDWLRTPEAQAARDSNKAAIAESQGHRGYEEVTGKLTSDEILELMKDPAPFDERMAAIPVENAIDVPLDEVNTRVHAQQYAAAEKAGVRLIYVTPPGYAGSPERLRLHEAGVIPELLHFNDPARFPKLFQLDHRFDKGHLNRRGVEVWSDAFADALLELLREGAGE